MEAEVAGRFSQVFDFEASGPMAIRRPLLARPINTEPVKVAHEERSGSWKLELASRTLIESS